MWERVEIIFRGSGHWSQGASIQSYELESFENHFQCHFDLFFFQNTDPAIDIA